MKSTNTHFTALSVMLSLPLAMLQWSLLSFGLALLGRVYQQQGDGAEILSLKYTISGVFGLLLLLLVLKVIAIWFIRSRLARQSRQES